MATHKAGAVKAAATKKYKTGMIAKVTLKKAHGKADKAKGGAVKAAKAGAKTAATTKGGGKQPVRTKAGAKKAK